jgi:hypothetical protein
MMRERVRITSEAIRQCEPMMLSIPEEIERQRAEAANPDILNTPAAIALRSAMRMQAAWAMGERERAEAAPPAQRTRGIATMDPVTGLVTMHEVPIDAPVMTRQEEIEIIRQEITRPLEAEARGVAWLKSCLSPEQLQDYDRSRSFVVIGEHTGNRYRICWGTSQNIIRLETSVDGREIPAERLCFGPRYRRELKCQLLASAFYEALRHELRSAHAQNVALSVAQNFDRGGVALDGAQSNIVGLQPAHRLGRENQLSERLSGRLRKILFSSITMARRKLNRK